jgi:hypothetical protein
MTYDEQYKRDKAVWEAKHPGQDYDMHINNLVDAEREN